MHDNRRPWERIQEKANIYILSETNVCQFLFFFSAFFSLDDITHIYEEIVTKIEAICFQAIRSDN